MFFCPLGPQAAAAAAAAAPAPALPPTSSTALPATLGCGACRGLLIVGVCALVAVLVGLVGSLRINCCLTLYLYLGSLITLGAHLPAHCKHLAALGAAASPPAAINHAEHVSAPEPRFTPPCLLAVQPSWASR